MKAVRKNPILLAILVMVILTIVISSCSPAATLQPQPQNTPLPTNPPATPTPVEESRLVELEWPEQMRIDASDIIRLALVPTKDGYVARAEFPDHTLQTKEVSVPRPGGYDLYAVARLDGLGFAVSPEGDQERFVPPGEEVAWRWSLRAETPGRQRLSVQVRLRWVPADGSSSTVRESQVLARGLEINVLSFLGMRPDQAAFAGTVGLFGGGALLVLALSGGRRAAGRRRTAGAEELDVKAPGGQVVVETPPDLTLFPADQPLLRAMFVQYRRLIVEKEFHSGYSGARTYLVRPIRQDDCADASTIVKVGPQATIRGEFENYETFVKDRLPPVTARIQRAPVRLRGGDRTAIQYTFLAEPGQPPVSLEQALKQDPNPETLQRLFEMFGPNWWMQRRPYTFRLAQEYDLLLPPHYVLEPLKDVSPRSGGPEITEMDVPGRLELRVGDVVRVRPFRRAEPRSDGLSQSLIGLPGAGSPALRLRWLDPEPPRRTIAARVAAGRQGLLEGLTAGFDRFGLPDPIRALPTVLDEVVAGTRSVIHGDLNLQNVLVGPGNLVWLIDFAQTREGHPLFDFARLEAELVAHVFAERCGSPEAFLSLWQAGADPLLAALHAIARRCQRDPDVPREYEMALYVSCLGALKYANLSDLSRHCLYLAAAEVSCRLWG